MKNFKVSYILVGVSDISKLIQLQLLDLLINFEFTFFIDNDIKGCVMGFLDLQCTCTNSTITTTTTCLFLSANIIIVITVYLS